MKGPFGMLLIGGGIILIVGLFTGKITFPGATGLGGQAITLPGGQQVVTNPNGQSVKATVGAGGKKTCAPGFVMGSDGNCYVNIGG